MRTIRKIIVALALAAAATSRAAEPDAPAAAGAWSGWSLGGQLGWAGGTARTTSAAAPASSASFGSLAGGLRLGVAGIVAPGTVAGAEGDVAFPNFLEGDDRVWRRSTAAGEVEERLDLTGTLRGRLGHVLGRTLVYGTGGLAWARGSFLSDAGGGAVEHPRFRGGWTAGAGVELPVGPAWTAGLEYRYVQLARTSAALDGAAAGSTLGMHGVWLTLAWRSPFGRDEASSREAALPPPPPPPLPRPAARAEEPALPVRPAALSVAAADVGGLASAPRPVPELPAGAAARAPAAAEDRDWNVHGQSTVVVQGYPAFRSPYSGENSLSGHGELRNTVSATAFVGLRPWEGAELYANPELMQGFGLSDTRGVAGFPNGEAQRSNFPVPRFNLARAYLSQVIGLGGETERVEDGPNQLAGERSVSRLTLTAGKLAVTDFFLVNAFAGEPRTGFLNWNVYGGGSYDWTMDLLSWTWGALAELNQARWAVRAGYFLLPAVSNTNRYDLDVPRNGQWVGEIEVRPEVLGRPGKLQAFAWLSHGNIGSYPAALAAAAPGAAPDVAATRGVDRYNYGFVLSAEQPVSDTLGLFARASWSPERGETMGWTDCGQSFSLGGVLRGTAWRRPADSLGVAAVVEGLSPVARRYFEAGGRGTIIGDGAMTYRPEVVLETYYTVARGPSAAITLDHQLVVNPGYNADRGPVSVSAVRLHAAF
jgi:high affinity Mn2+ porin